MAKNRKKKRRDYRPGPRAKVRNAPEASFEQLYTRAGQLASEGQHAQARRLFQALESKAQDVRRQALLGNDLAALAVLDGDLAAGRRGFQAALALDAQCQPAKTNLTLLDADIVEAEGLPPPTPDGVLPALKTAGEPPIRVAILSFLFNWPSTGGGIVHTVELAQFLSRAGYEVKHFFARHAPWEVGQVTRSLPYPHQALEFAEAGWNVPAIQERFRQAVRAFAPDYVIITDSWNMKPLLAEAVCDYPYVLRFQAMECLCPLNNLRLLGEAGGRFRQCPKHQLANPQDCAQCVAERGRHSGQLHQAERALSGVGQADYHPRLLKVLRQAEAVLVVNALHEAMLSPYSERVRVVTSGFDPQRFPWPWPEEPVEDRSDRVVLFFAGLVEEQIKGFDVLREACALLWERRCDFELWATGDPPGPVDTFTRFIGWQAQEDLPRHLRAADVLVMPTIAQEALGRTAVEAMGVGRPVVASRLGGLPFTIVDGATGLLCAPGDAADLAATIERLLDDAELRQRLGLAGRRRFEEHYTWDVIIERHYRQLLQRRVSPP